MLIRFYKNSPLYGILSGPVNLNSANNASIIKKITSIHQNYTEKGQVIMFLLDSKTVTNIPALKVSRLNFC